MATTSQLNRRTVLATGLTTSAGGALLTGTHPQSALGADKLDLDDPDTLMQVYTRMRGTADGGSSIWFGQSTYFGQLDNEPPVSLFMAESFSYSTLIYKGDATVEERSTIVQYFADKDTRAVITSWENTFTGETIPMVRPRNFHSATITAGTIAGKERNDYINIDRTGTFGPAIVQAGHVTITHDQNAKFSRPVDENDPSKGVRRWWSGIFANYSASLSDLTDETRQFIPCHSTMFAAAPWYTWLRMGDRAGISGIRGHSSKVARVEDVPPHILAWVEREHGDLLDERPI